MSDEHTRNLPDTRSFEERVFARFDAIDAGLRDLNARVERLEAESEQRAADTKPIWERALAEIAAVGRQVDALSGEIAELREEVTVLSRKVGSVENKIEEIVIDMLGLRADHRQLRKRVDKLDSEHAR